jgi:hypothetical protein
MSCCLYRTALRAEHSTMAKTIRQRRHRATLNRAEQRLDPIVEPYDERHRAERLEILWNEAHPHLLARANDDDRKQQDEYVRLSSKTSASLVAMFHTRLRGSKLCAGGTPHRGHQTMNSWARISWSLRPSARSHRQPSTLLLVFSKKARDRKPAEHSEEWENSTT